MKKTKQETVFKTTQEHHDFGEKHGVWGKEAIKLKEQMIKLALQIIGKPPKELQG